MAVAILLCILFFWKTVWVEFILIDQSNSMLETYNLDARILMSCIFCFKTKHNTFFFVIVWRGKKTMQKSAFSNRARRWGCHVWNTHSVPRLSLSFWYLVSITLFQRDKRATSLVFCMCHMFFVCAFFASFCYTFVEWCFRCVGVLFVVCVTVFAIFEWGFYNY